MKKSFQCLKYFSEIGKLDINFLDVLTHLCNHHEALDHLEPLKVFYEDFINKSSEVPAQVLSESSICSTLQKQFELVNVCALCPYSCSYTNEHQDEEYTVLAYLLSNKKDSNSFDVSSINEDSFTSKVCIDYAQVHNKSIILELHKAIYNALKYPKEDHGLKILDFVKKSIGSLSEKTTAYVLDYYVTLTGINPSSRSVKDSIRKLSNIKKVPNQQQDIIADEIIIVTNSDATECNEKEVKNKPYSPKNETKKQKQVDNAAPKKKPNNTKKKPTGRGKKRSKSLENQLSILDKEYEHLIGSDSSSKQKKEDKPAVAPPAPTTAEQSDLQDMEIPSSAEPKMDISAPILQEKGIIINEKNYSTLDRAIMSDSQISLKLISDYLVIYSISDRELYYLPKDNYDLIKDFAYYIEEKDYVKICFDSISLLKYFIDLNIHYKNIFDIKLVYDIIPNNSYKTNELDIIKEYTGEIIKPDQYYNILKLYPVIHKTMTCKKLTLHQLTQYTREINYLSFLAASLNVFKKLGIDNLDLLKVNETGKLTFSFSGSVASLGSRVEECFFAVKINNKLLEPKSNLFKACAVTLYKRLNVIKTNTNIINLTDDTFQIMTHKKYQSELFDIININLTNLVKKYDQENIPSISIEIV